MEVGREEGCYMAALKFPTVLVLLLSFSDLSTYLSNGLLVVDL